MLFAIFTSSICLHFEGSAMPTGAVLSRAAPPPTANLEM